MESDLDRRTLLVGSAAGLAGLAGCSGLTGGDGGDGGNSTDNQGTDTDAITAADSGPARFSKVQIRGPDEVAVNEEFSLTVSVANVGGTKGDFTSTLTVDVGGLQRDGSVKIEDVPPGERKQTTIDGLKMSYVTDVSFLITDHAAEQAVSVTRAARGFGEALDAQDASVTVQDVRFQSTYVVGSGEDQEAFGPQEGDVFGLVLLQVEEDGSGLVDTHFTIPGGTVASRLGYIAVSDLLEQIDAPGQQLSELDGSGQAWILAEFDAETVGEPAIELDTNRDGTTDVRWTGTPSEPAPLVSVTSIETPDSAEIGTEQTATIELTNEGEGTANVAGIIQRDSGAITETWANIRTFTQKVPPGTTRAERVTIQQPCLGDARFRVHPLTEPFGVTFTEAVRDFGSPYTGPLGIRVTIRQVVLADAYEVPSAFGGTETMEPSSGRQWALVNLVAEATGEESATPPQRDTLAPIYRDQRFETEGTNSFDEKITDPISGPIYPGAYSLSPGKQVGGWLAYEVPTGASENDLAFAWSKGVGFSGCEIQARWE
jgi:hypothetical protein